MSRRFYCLLCIVPLLGAGCVDPVLMRKTIISQYATERLPSEHFTVDTSRLPPDWVERGKLESPNGTIDVVKINLHRRVKILIVPEDSATETGTTQDAHK